MGCESTAASPGGKRGRDPEEEVYLDNFHSHKRYLSEIMASSLNGLTVGESMAENLMDSPVRSESNCYTRDEIASEYSPMSEDSDDSRFCDNPINSVLQSDVSTCNAAPVSPHRHQRAQTAPATALFPPLPGCTLAAVVCSHPRQRGSDDGGRFPSSPNDMCHTGDLRRTALLRSVQIRTQGEEKPCSFMKDEGGFQMEREGEEYIEECSSVDGISEA
ncbi:uncharacterized protein LOC110031105 isoform X2 [Phalaenopsis equestris]|uniref:uncharacterized protein LOC110031105 isoform X2 n=1 Tax=Phalaenopsis equestris TaxID=78828 RepID=UPI0009E29189|nr:uncharacterized protein LOC110031105 isoform X2 [Phalaenopsis equestris]